MAYIESDGGDGYWYRDTFYADTRQWYIVTDDPFGRIDCESKADAERKLKEYRARLPRKGTP